MEFFACRAFDSTWIDRRRGGCELTRQSSGAPWAPTRAPGLDADTALSSQFVIAWRQPAWPIRSHRPVQQAKATSPPVSCRPTSHLRSEGHNGRFEVRGSTRARHISRHAASVIQGKEMSE